MTDAILKSIIFIVGLSGCFSFKTYTYRMMAHIKMEKLEMEIAYFVVK